MPLGFLMRVRKLNSIENVYLKCEQNVTEFEKIYENIIEKLLNTTKNIKFAQFSKKHGCV